MRVVEVSTIPPARLDGLARYTVRVLTQLNRGEERHCLAREVFDGRRGELRHRCHEE